MIDHVKEYAEKIVNKEVIAGKPVIDTCKRHLNDLKRSETDHCTYYFDVKKAGIIINFIELLPNTTTGEKMVLAPFQKFIIGSLYGWAHKTTGYRRFNKATISLSRKQGK